MNKTTPIYFGGGSLKIIFVRHGSTARNENHTHQNKEEPLSKEGLIQAERVANRLKGVKADLILSSRCRRAVQTAHAISNSIGKRVIYTSLLNELADPSEFFGKEYVVDSVVRIAEEIRAHAADPKWHYSDEENFFDLKKRAIRALEFIKSKKAETVIVVTHSVFMRMVLYVGIFGEDADAPDNFHKFRTAVRTHNGAITECEISEGNFKLITFNDSAHLH